MPFQKGHKLAKGGSRDTSGRPLAWVREYCKELISNHRLLPRLAQIASGEKIFEKPVVIKNGDESHIEMVSSAAEPHTQLYAIEKLMDRAYGKVKELDGESNQNNNYLMIVNFFKILEEFSHDQSAIPKLREALEKAQIMANGESLQDQGQEQESDQSEVQQHTTENL